MPHPLIHKPLQGFFNLVVYMFPRILRYFEEGVPLTQSFRRNKSSIFSSLQFSAKKRKSQTPTQVETTQASCAEGVTEIGENGDAPEAPEVDAADAADKEAEQDAFEDNVEDGESGEEGKRDGEKDAIDELEYIVEA